MLSLSLLPEISSGQLPENAPELPENASLPTYTCIRTCLSTKKSDEIHWKINEKTNEKSKNIKTTSMETHRKNKWKFDQRLMKNLWKPISSRPPAKRHAMWSRMRFADLMGTCWRAGSSLPEPFRNPSGSLPEGTWSQYAAAAAAMNISRVFNENQQKINRKFVVQLKSAQEKFRHMEGQVRYCYTPMYTQRGELLCIHKTLHACVYGCHVNPYGNMFRKPSRRCIYPSGKLFP